MKLEYIRIRAARKFLAELKNGHYIDVERSAAVICTNKGVNESQISIPYCCLQFIDTEDPFAEQAFTREKAAIIRDFLSELSDRVTTLYCCCDWGQSRSAGLAAACMTFLKQNEDSVFENPVYSPNLLVYVYMCEALGCGRPSEERIRELKWKRSAAAVYQQKNFLAKINRIVITGDPGSVCSLINSSQSGETLEWPNILEKMISKPVINCGFQGKTIPYTERELLKDRKELGLLYPEDLLVVLYGVNDLCLYTDESTFNSAVYETADKLRKYILWLKYIYPGLNLLLIAPPCGSFDADELREQTEELSFWVSKLADDLNVLFMDAGEWELSRSENAGRSSDPDDVQQQFAEILARYLKEIGL